MLPQAEVVSDGRDTIKPIDLVAQHSPGKPLAKISLDNELFMFYISAQVNKCRNTERDR